MIYRTNRTEKREVTGSTPVPTTCSAVTRAGAGTSVGAFSQRRRDGKA